MGWLLLLALLPACGGRYLEQPPFQAGDTVHFDKRNWYYLAPEPDAEGRFAFSYRIFEFGDQGLLAHTEDRIYLIRKDERTVLMDYALQPGDTVYKFSEFQYYLLLDRRQDPAAGGEVYYLLRRSNIGVKRFRERTIWVLAPGRGILAAAKYDIAPSDGRVSLEVVGEPGWFDGPDILRQIQLLDSDPAWLVDSDQGVLYKFDKTRNLLTSRDFRGGKDLHAYQFHSFRPEALASLRITLALDTLRLQAGDSCFYLSRQLELLRTARCY